MGIPNIIIRKTPHLSKACCFFVASFRSTDLNLNRRKDNGIIMIVINSIIYFITKSTFDSTKINPGNNNSLSNTKTSNSVTRRIKENKYFNVLITFFIYYLPSNVVLLMIERPKVTSSVYSNSSPMETPRAMVVNFTPVPSNFR